MRTYPATDACETTMTPRSWVTCDCPTYDGNWGVCDTWEEGSNSRCVYCDHTEMCHLKYKLKIMQRALDRMMANRLWYFTRGIAVGWIGFMALVMILEAFAK